MYDMKTDLLKLRNILLERYKADEIVEITHRLGVAQYINLAGSPATVVTSLLAYLRQTGRIEDLILIIQETRPDVLNESEIIPIVKPETPGDELVGLNVEIANIQQQLLELKDASQNNETLRNRLEEVIQVADRAVGRSDELTAKILLPPSELTDVPLVPIHTLERLEEYRSDENIGYLLIGLFGGAVLGILSNWATDVNFIISRFSVVLILIFIALIIASGLWTRRIHQRAVSIKEKILQQSST